MRYRWETSGDREAEEKNEFLIKIFTGWFSFFFVDAIMIFGLHDNIIFINPILKTMCVKV